MTIPEKYIRASSVNLAERAEQASGLRIWKRKGASPQDWTEDAPKNDESGTGAPHSKTLPRVSVAPGNSARSWSAALLCRFVPQLREPTEVKKFRDYVDFPLSEEIFGR